MSMICELHSIPAESIDELTRDPFDVLDQLDPDAALSLEKSWHGLHFVFTGSAWAGDPPLNFLLLGGTTLGDEDDEEGGYGPPRLIRPEDVRAIEQALGRFDEAEFDRRFVSADLTAADIYPNIWDEELDDLREEYLGYLNELKEFVGRAAADGRAIVVTLT